MEGGDDDDSATVVWAGDSGGKSISMLSPVSTGGRDMGLDMLGSSVDGELLTKLLRENGVSGGLGGGASLYWDPVESQSLAF